MTKSSFSRVSMLASGLLAALVILLSHSFHAEASKYLSKIQSEESKKPVGAEEKVLIAAPADAVTTSPAGEVENTNFSLIRELICEQRQTSARPAIEEILVNSLFKTLFRTIISPQAP